MRPIRWYAARSGRLTSVRLTGFSPERIHRLDQKLNAMIETNPDAVREARASDRHRDRHRARSALEGIPVLLKDNVDIADPAGDDSRVPAGLSPARRAASRWWRSIAAITRMNTPALR